MRFVKLSVSNLDKDVTTKELKELLSEYADVRRITIHSYLGHKSQKYAHVEIKGRQGAENLVKWSDWKAAGAAGP